MSTPPSGDRARSGPLRGREPPSPPSLAETSIREGDTIRSGQSSIPGPETIPALLRRNAEMFGGLPAFREKKSGGYRDMTWDRLLLTVVSFGGFLRSRGVRKGDRVAVISRNRAEMLVAEFSVMSIGAVYVPLFPGYSPEQTRELIQHSGSRIVLASDRTQREKIAGLAEIELVVSFDAVARAKAARTASGGNETVISYDTAINKLPPDDLDPAAVGEFFALAADLRPEDPCLMMYTSGTAGEQKGVRLCHRNILSQRRAIDRIWSVTSQDRLLCYLPWHHSFGGIFEKYTALYHGAPLAIDQSYGKDFGLLLQNWKEIKPTIYFSVPTIYQELVNHVQVHPDEEEEIFHKGLRFVFTAAAPLPANISEFFAARGIPVVEGWGLTETSPCCTLTDFHEPRAIPGMVGYPIPDVEVQIASDGEILVRGPNVMLGYHANPEATKRVLPGDGWFRTGDLGEFVGAGLRLVARKDRIFKLLNGERVVPTPIENALVGRSRYIQHALVVGSGTNSLSALIFPNYFLIEEEFGEDWETADRIVKESIRQSVEELNRTHPVRYERIDAFAVVSKRLTVEDHELTPTMKVRVRNVLKNCEPILEAIYRPGKDCDCRFLMRIIRLTPDDRRCFMGKDVTIDHCHECGLCLVPDSGSGSELRSPPRSLYIADSEENDG